MILRPWVSTVPPEFMPIGFVAPCSPSQVAISYCAIVVALPRCDTATASAMWSPWPCVTRTTSADAACADAGHFGFDSSQGSTSTLTPPGVVICQVACPSQVIVVFSGIGASSAVALRKA